VRVCGEKVGGRGGFIGGLAWARGLGFAEMGTTFDGGGGSHDRAGLLARGRC
jgi:hypothetical protein